MREKAPLGYIIAMFDVIGFEFRLKKFGLEEIYSRYERIVDFVRQQTKRSQLISDNLNITGPFWLAEGSMANLYEIEVINSSDTIMIWTNLAWKMVRDKSTDELKKNELHPATGHLSKPIPLIDFWNTCAELICRSIEFDLPLRGAITTGDLIIDKPNNVYLGEPIVDTARLENKQICIGMSRCNSFDEHIETKMFFIPYSAHYKPDYNKERKDFAFNWPMYWRKSRPDLNIIEILNEMSEKNDNHPYYKNTIEFVKYSESLTNIR